MGHTSPAALSQTVMMRSILGGFQGSQTHPSFCCAVPLWRCQPFAKPGSQGVGLLILPGAASGIGLEAVLAHVIEQGLGQDAARRVVGAKEQNVQRGCGGHGLAARRGCCGLRAAAGGWLCDGCQRECSRWTQLCERGIFPWSFPCWQWQTVASAVKQPSPAQQFSVR